MSKITLVLRPDEFTSFTSYYLENFWRKYFNIELFNSDKSYDAKSTIFVGWVTNVNDEYLQQLTNLGYKVVIDHLWEVPKLTSNKNYYELHNRNWCWYNESLWWQSLGYHNYVPEKNYKKIAFMPIRRPSKQRDMIIESLGARLDNFIWSYQDKKLPNDVSTVEPHYQRFFNPEWYDDTYFSTVLETMQHGLCWWPTDKTFKACAYYHPFLIIGQHHTLKRLKELGFETYDNIFDESYDGIEDFNARLDAIIKNIDNFDTKPYDSVTNEKLQHNHNLFFNKELIEQRILKEIVEPLIGYAET
jgi:hypothetical protein